MAAAAVLAALEILLQNRVAPGQLPASSASWAPLFILVNVVLFVIVFMYYNETILRRAEAQLQSEMQRSEALLHNILPGPIVARLKESNETIADGFSSATVLFADIVGFTQMAARQTPESLVRLLNTIFSSFDRLVQKHGLEKIKTIGDAYMAVGGLPNPRTDHLQSVCQLGLDMLADIARLAREEGVELDVRVGIHTGPVTAGVIGLHKFSYDLWGDTVNTASRMESHGRPGQVHVSEAVYAGLGNIFRFEARGKIAIKGKGEMATYFLHPPSGDAGPA